MNKSIVILSTYVDRLIQEKQPDVKIELFKSLTELEAYVEESPLRADVLYITAEIIEPTVNSSLSLLLKLVEKNHFFKVNRVEYITSADRKSLASVRYLIDSEELTNWSIHKGHMTREYISGLISGTLKPDDVMPQRKAVYRQRKDEYLKTRMGSGDLSEKFPTESDLLEDVESTGTTPILIHEVEEVCKQINIAGLPTRERTIFTFLMAQYLSFSGKTIVVEKDYEYLTLSDIASKSGVDFLEILVEDLYRDPQKVLRKIKVSESRLIVVTTRQRGSTSYLFLCNLLYNNLSDKLSYFVKENDFNEVSRSADYVAVVPNNVVDILRTTEALPLGYENHARFASVNMTKLPGYTVNNSKQLGVILKDVLQLKGDVEVPIFNISSLKLGGEVHDLRLLIN